MSSWECPANIRDVALLCWRLSGDGALLFWDPFAAALKPSCVAIRNRAKSSSVDAMTIYLSFSTLGSFPDIPSNLTHVSSPSIQRTFRTRCGLPNLLAASPMSVLQIFNEVSVLAVVIRRPLDQGGIGGIGRVSSPNNDAVAALPAPTPATSAPSTGSVEAVNPPAKKTRTEEQRQELRTSEQPGVQFRVHPAPQPPPTATAPSSFSVRYEVIYPYSGGVLRVFGEHSLLQICGQ